MSDKDFLYKATFDSVIYASDSEELNYRSSAALDSLKDLLPYDIDLSKNVDLIPVAFDAAVINQFNRNDDGISAATANSVKRFFVHKPTNIEHDRSRIIGHVTNAAFTERETHKYIHPDEAVRMTDPFNLSLGGVVYKLIDEEFTDILSNALATKKGTHVISASWELGFNNFGVAIGGQNIKNCKIVTDPIKVAALAPHLKCFGGDGYAPDGQRIYRLIIGDIYPLGIGFTEKPAADVRGVYTNDPFEIVAEDAISEPKVAKEEDFAADKRDEISQSEKMNVKTHNKKPNKLMDFKEQIKAALDEYGISKISEESLAGLTKDIVEAVKEANKSYLADKEAAELAEQEAKKQLEELQASVKELNEKLEAAQEKIKEFEDAAEQEAIASARDGRMEQIDNVYELDDEDRKIVLADLAEFDPRDDEKFDAYASRLAVLWKNKNKEAIAAQEKELQDQIEAKVQEALKEEATASDKADDKGEKVQDAAASANTDDEDKVKNNSTASEDETLENRFSKYFGDEDIKVTF